MSIQASRKNKNALIEPKVKPSRFRQRLEGPTFLQTQLQSLPTNLSSFMFIPKTLSSFEPLIDRHKFMAGPQKNHSRREAERASAPASQ
jgi:hypothetical protein